MSSNYHDEQTKEIELLRHRREEAVSIIGRVDLGHVLQIAQAMYFGAISRGGKIIAFGNGGSAAQASHLVAELIGRFSAKRDGVAAIDLGACTPAITAIGNDLGYDEIFRRQVAALLKKDDCVVGFTTSGESSNVIGALKTAMLPKYDASVVALTGQSGLPSIRTASIQLVKIASTVTARVQEGHQVVIHMICELIDKWISEDRRR